MARRIERVETNIQRIVGQIIDQGLQPPGMVSVTSVTCDSGLTHARIAVSVLATGRGVAVADDTIAYLVSHASFIRGALSRRSAMRRTPRLHFILDTSIADGQYMLDRIDRRFGR